MEGTPAHIQLAELETAMKKIPGVKSVHDLHLWSITSGVDSLSAHIMIETRAMSNQVLFRLQETLKEKFKIQHTTI